MMTMTQTSSPLGGTPGAMQFLPSFMARESCLNTGNVFNASWVVCNDQKSMRRGKKKKTNTPAHLRPMSAQEIMRAGFQVLALTSPKMNVAIVRNSAGSHSAITVGSLWATRPNFLDVPGYLMRLPQLQQIDLLGLACHPSLFTLICELPAKHLQVWIGAHDQACPIFLHTFYLQKHPRVQHIQRSS